MRTSAFTGTGALIRLALRRDRIKLLLWLLGITLVTAGSTATYMELFVSDQDIREAIALRAGNPVMRAFDAPASGASVGAFTMIRISGFLAVLAALMSAQTVVRHTRQNEETGRSEMIGSAAVGRHASLTAALAVTVSANALLAVMIALAMIAGGLPAAGSFAAGTAFGGLGLAFAGIAAVTAQLSAGSRGANGLAGAAIGAFFVVSSIGNMLGEVKESGVEVVSAWPAWLSPFGWYQQIHAFHQNNWWILGLFAVLCAALVGTAFLLTARRDVGMGMLPDRRGPAAASRSLLSPLRLAWRLQRGLWLGWTLAMVAMGVLFGAVSTDLEEMVEGNERIAELLGGMTGLADAFLISLLSMMGMFVAVYLVQALLRMRSEEADGLAEAVLAAAVSRFRWMMSHIVIALLGSAVMLALMGLGASLASGAGEGAGTQAAKLLEAALIQIPAVLALAGFIIAVFGLLPRWSAALAWAALAVSLAAGPIFSSLFNLPQAVKNLSPFTHLPAIPAEEVTASPIVALFTVAVVLIAAGLVWFRRRSLSL